MKQKIEELKMREEQKKNKHRQLIVENMGSWEKGDRLQRVVGQKKDRETGQVMCLCEWYKRKDGVWPLKTY